MRKSEFLSNGALQLDLLRTFRVRLPSVVQGSFAQVFAKFVCQDCLARQEFRKQTAKNVTVSLKAKYLSVNTEKRSWEIGHSSGQYYRHFARDWGMRRWENVASRLLVSAAFFISRWLYWSSADSVCHFRHICENNTAPLLMCTVHFSTLRASPCPSYFIVSSVIFSRTLVCFLFRLKLQYSSQSHTT